MIADTITHELPVTGGGRAPPEHLASDAPVTSPAPGLPTRNQAKVRGWAGAGPVLGLLQALIWLCGGALGLGAEAGASSGALGSLADLPLEDLPNIRIETVSGASGYEQPVSRAPASISIITADEIKKLGFRTLAEVLESVPGFYVTDDLNYSYLGVRGFNRPGDYNSRVLLLVDGHRLNDNIYGQALLGTEGVIDVDLIERVEVIRGPASSLYGDNAFFGVINITTRPGSSFRGAEASVEAGGFDTFKGRFSYGQKFTNDLELTLSGSWYDSGGASQVYFPQFNTAAQNHGVAQDSDGDNYQSFFGSLRWQELSVSAAFSRREKQVPTASFNTVFDAGKEETTDTRGYIDVKLDHEFTSNTRLTARAYYDIYSYEGLYPYYATNAALPLRPVYVAVNEDVGFGQWVGTEWQLTQKLFDKHTLVAGVEYRQDLEQLQHTYYREPGFPDIRISERDNNVGLYAQAEVALLTNLTFNGGVRYDYYSTFGGTVTPRLGLMYSPWRQTDFKFLYGEAFRAPNAFELYYEDPGANKANPHLDPERIRSYDLVYEQELPARCRFSASGYYYEITDLISQQTDGLGQTYFANSGGADSKGVELNLEHRSTAGFLARASYSFQRAQDSNTGQELSNCPENLAKLSLIVPIYRDKVFAGGQVNYTDRVLTLSGKHADAFTTVSLTLLACKVVKGLEASASVYNLFDTHYGYPASADFRQDVIPGQGRDFRVKLTYRF